MKNNDNLFEKRDIFNEKLSVSGIEVISDNENLTVRKTNKHKKCIITPLRHGCIYVVRFSKKPDLAKIGISKTKPENNLSLEKVCDVKRDEISDVMYVPQEEGLYLVIYCEGSDYKMHIDEAPVILGYDTEDCWFYPPKSGDLNGRHDSWGDWRWTAEELCNNVYDPLVEKYPDYIRKISIGKDESGKYDMPAYIFEPKDYEQVLFISGGLHGNEQCGYLALARLLELVANSENANEGLEYLRRKVKLIVIPLVNVWSSYETRVRFNCNGIDLNRDFELLSQKESQNVANLLQRFKDEIGAVIDCHTAPSKFPSLFYQFNVQASNSAVSRKVINHIFERLKEKNYETAPADLSFIPGKYIKSTHFLQGYAFNVLNISNIVIEHNEDKWYPLYSAEGLQFAVECYGNFVIQTALAKLKILK